MYNENKKKKQAYFNECPIGDLTAHSNPSFRRTK